MTLKTSTKTYLYSYKYDFHHRDLCKLEARQIFGLDLSAEESDKLLFSDVEIDPSISAFIKNRLNILLVAESYSGLLKNIKKQDIQKEGFKVEYLALAGDTADFSERRKKQKDVGYRIMGEPDFENPSITYGIGKFKSKWYFGVLLKHDIDWHKHKNKPCSFSNSIDMNIGKTLVSIASKGNKAFSLLDACCGVGTVMLEACCAGFRISGCEINWKAAKHSKENLAYFGYNAAVHCLDIKDHNLKYDAAIIDLPYNLYSYSNETIAENIVSSTAKLSQRIVIVSIADIAPLLIKAGLKVTDYCTVEKKGKSAFTRKIWVCEKGGLD